MELFSMLGQEWKLQLKRAADFKRVKADLNHIQKELGFYPKIKFSDGLKIYIDWCKINFFRLSVL